MAEAVNVANIDVAEVMNREGVKDGVDKFLASMEENPAVAKLLETAKNVEDAYEVAKNYIKIKLEDFKVIFDKTVDYLKESKTELSDEVMDTIVGGWSFGSWWDKWKKTVISISIVVGAAALCAVTGGIAGVAIAGSLAGAAGAVIGTAVGSAAGAYTVDYLDKKGIL